ncbi:MAG: hypothetical protein PVG07_11935 [Acidobacteriota bacterium]
MKLRKIVGLVLLIGGILALVYGGFTYTEDRHAAELGPVKLEFKDRERVAIPPWAGVVAVVGGVVLLAWRR